MKSELHMALNFVLYKNKSNTKSTQSFSCTFEASSIALSLSALAFSSENIDGKKEKVR